MFDSPHDVKYAVMPGAGKIGIRLPSWCAWTCRPSRALHRPVKNAAWRIDNRSTIVEFDIDQSSGFHDFKAGTKVVPISRHQDGRRAIIRPAWRSRR